MSKELKDILDNIIKEIGIGNYHINAGGCGWFAYLLAKKLFELGIYYKVVVIGAPAGSRKLINTLRLQEHEIPQVYWLSARHYMLKIGDYYIDGSYVGKGIPEFHRGYVNSSSFLYPQNIRVACLEGDWNDFFDVDDVPEIEHIINKHFKTYY